METNTPKYHHMPENMFKSYYVVWKRTQIFFLFLFFVLFKSYYVVWKQQQRTTNRIDVFSLNRTM